MELIAEIGGNHKGDFNLAEKLVKDACNSSSTVIKLQLYSADGLVNKSTDPQRHAHFSKFQLTKNEYIRLISIIKSSGKKFCASIWDDGMLDWAMPYVDILKIGSGDFNCLPIIDSVLSHGKEIILSTGLCNKTEVDNVYDWVASNVSIEFLREKVTIMQCTSMYPIPYNEANLRVINAYRSSFDCKIGYSDHTMGLDALLQAIAMEVDSIEYHYTLNKADTSFRDNLVSLEKDDVDYLCLFHERTKKLLGNGLKEPTNSELESNHVYSFRRGCYAKRDLSKGEKITSNDVFFRRPYIENSISPMRFTSDSVQLELKQDVKKNEVIF